MLKDRIDYYKQIESERKSKLLVYITGDKPGMARSAGTLISLGADNILHPHFDPTMVNFTSVITSAPNEFYVPKTESPESLASLIKDTITIEYSLNPVEENEAEKDAR